MNRTRFRTNQIEMYHTAATKWLKNTAQREAKENKPAGPGGNASPSTGSANSCADPAEVDPSADLISSMVMPSNIPTRPTVSESGRKQVRSAILEIEIVPLSSLASSSHIFPAKESQMPVLIRNLLSTAQMRSPSSTLTNCIKAERIKSSSAVETPQKRIETNPRFKQTHTKPVGLTQIIARAERKKERKKAVELTKHKHNHHTHKLNPMSKATIDTNIHLLFPTVALLQRLINSGSDIIIKLEQKKHSNTHQYWIETPGRPQNLQPSNAHKKYVKT